MLYIKKIDANGNVSVRSISQDAKIPDGIIPAVTLAEGESFITKDEFDALAKQIMGQ